MFTDENGAEQTLDEKAPVSMNLWGFLPDYFRTTPTASSASSSTTTSTLPSRVLHPLCIDTLISSGEATVRVLDTPPPAPRLAGLLCVTPPAARVVVLFADLTPQRGIPLALFGK